MLEARHFLPPRPLATEPADEAAAGRPVEIGVQVVAIAKPGVAAGNDVVVAQRYVHLDNERCARGDVGGNIVVELGEPVVSSTGPGRIGCGYERREGEAARQCATKHVS